MMSYEKLDVYQCAIEFLGISVQIVDEMPKGNAQLIDQLKRASISIPLNIAEGAGKKTQTDCKRFFAIARGSTMECGAILDVSRKLRLANEDQVEAGKRLLERIVAMLTKLTL